MCNNKTKSEKNYEIFEKCREDIGDTALLDMIVAWWGYEDVNNFLEENSSELEIDLSDDNEEEE